MKKSILISFIILFLLAAGGSSAAIYYYFQYQKVMTQINDPDFVVKDVLAKVGKLVELPTDEKPTVATVNDPELIKDQAFFAKSKKGDRVILYPAAHIAILFDEKANKIINFGTINVSNTSTPSATVNAATPQAPFVPMQ